MAARKGRWDNVVPDPGIQHGKYKVLNRTDGKSAIVYDTTAPTARATVCVRRTAKECAKIAEKLAGPEGEAYYPEVFGTLPEPKPNSPEDVGGYRPPPPEDE